MVAFGTAGEKALRDAFHAQFPNAKHLLCFIHMKNRKIKLCDLGIHVDISKGFIVDIFGKQQGTHKLCGLVDSKAETCSKNRPCATSTQLSSAMQSVTVYGLY